MESKVFTYGELSIPFNLADYEVMERLETAHEVFKQAATDAKAHGRASAQTRAIIEAVNAFLDSVLGAGSAQKAHGGTKDAEVAMDALAALFAFAEEQKSASAEKMSRYLPVGNK